MITKSKGKLDAIYPALLATINNIAAYLENLGIQSSLKLLHLYILMSSPSFLLANETNHLLLHSLLEAMNAIIEHQYTREFLLRNLRTLGFANYAAGNPNFIDAILKYKNKFEALRSFTLESGQEEIRRINERRKDQISEQANSPSHASRNTFIESPRSPQGIRSPALSNVPEEGDAFAIGDDEDSENEEDRELMPTPSQSSPSAHNSRTPSISSSTDERLPTQLRGMSEKARGKMPAGQPSFSRQGSMTSLCIHPATIVSATPSFNPSPQWVSHAAFDETLQLCYLSNITMQIDSWLPSLPLHTVLTLISTSRSPTLPLNIDPSPPRIHLFEWTPLSLGWYESLLWGFIFASEMIVQKGTVGVWNGTNIRLFRVEKEAARGPSLMKPMGAVDAVGSNLVMRIGGLNRRGTSGVGPVQNGRDG